jgi:AcrR family transcriptional regulator
MRTQIMESMLVCCGEVGYRRVAVEQVYRHYGGYRTQFYKHFSSKGDCFAAAYEAESERLCQRMLSFVGKDKGSGPRLESALNDLAELIVAKPAVAKALFLEVHVAGGPSLDKRREVVERLARAVDGACRPSASRRSPPPTSGDFIIGAIEEAVSNSLAKDEPKEFTSVIPELIEIVRHVYSD